MNDIIILPTETIHPQKSSWHVKTTFIFDTDSNFTKKKHRPKKSPLDEHVPKMVTIKELSNLTGLSEYCIRKLCKQNKIHFSLFFCCYVKKNRQFWDEFLNLTQTIDDGRLQKDRFGR